MGMAPRLPADVAIQRVDGTWIATGTTTKPQRVTRQATEATIGFTLTNGSSNPTGSLRYLVIVRAVNGSYQREYTGAWRRVDAFNDYRTLYGLQPNTEYSFSIWNQGLDPNSGSAHIGGFNVSSAEYRGYFVTNRSPSVPELRSPPNDAQFAVGSNFALQAVAGDPDNGNGINPTDDLNTIQFRVRTKATPTTPAGPWIAHNLLAKSGEIAGSSIGMQPYGGQAYEWQAAAGDKGGLWSAWSGIRTYFLTADVAPPTLLSPARGQGVSVKGPIVFRIRHRSPTGSQMNRFIIYFRLKGEEGWWPIVTHDGGPNADGEGLYALDPATVPGLQAGYHYEWTATTRDTRGRESPAAQASDFYVTAAPGSAIPVMPESTTLAPPLGRGDNRVFIYERGGQRLLGEITPLVKVKWSRVRDDISDCTFTIEDFDQCRELLSSLRSWQHEVVVFRDNGSGQERVWEGPITHLQYEVGRVTVSAKDVMAYVYRRVMRLGYNDSYQLETPGYWNGTRYIYGWGQIGLRSVVLRAEQIILNALSYDDPNVIPYLMSLTTGNDTVQSRIVQAYSKSAWQEVDDLAAKAGLDYTTVGRRIMLWDTHEKIGMLPEMTDGDFGDSPVVTEYGMQTATDFVVTNNNGVYGISSKAEGHRYLGFVEQIASAYSENEASAGPAETLTAKARQELEATLTGQAQRNIAPRYPTPLVVRVPDNTTLNPDLNLGINQIVPGVYIPLRATDTLREVNQVQKLDRMACEQTSDGETITVTMSPAPGVLGDDPDADEGVME